MTLRGQSQTTWCILVNWLTCPKGWKHWQSFLVSNGIDHVLHHSNTIDEAKNVLTGWYHNGHRHFLFVGGDGTLHHGGNILMELSGSRSYEITIGILPCGTGNDWARTYGVPKNKLAQHLREGYTAPLNLIKLTWPDGKMRYAFNMVGGALDASVVSNLTGASRRIPSSLLYPYGLLKTLMKPHTWTGIITTERDTYKGEVMTIQAGFGKYCGGGMYVLPHSREDSPGLLIMKPKSLGKILWHLPQVYNGKIIHQQESMAWHFEEIEINHAGIPIPFEADGEWLGTSPVKLTACFDAMKRIV